MTYKYVFFLEGTQTQQTSELEQITLSAPVTSHVSQCLTGLTVPDRTGLVHTIVNPITSLTYTIVFVNLMLILALQCVHMYVCTPTAQVDDV